MSGRGDILSWNAENIVFSLFSAKPHQESAANLFREAFGTDPVAANENTHPQLGKLGSASSRPDAGMVRVVQLQPGRCDIALHPSGDQVALGSYPSTLKDFLVHVDLICADAAKLISKVPEINRVALNCRFSRHFETVEEANAELKKVLPFAFDLTSERDFVLQFNRRGTEAGVALNRILKWVCEPIQVIGSPYGELGPSSVLREFWAAVVHFDFNTVAPRPIFSPQEVAAGLSAVRDGVVKVRKNNLRFEK